MKGGATYSSRAPSESEAKLYFLRECQARANASRCELIYSACSMSEFKYSADVNAGIGWAWLHAEVLLVFF